MAHCKQSHYLLFLIANPILNLLPPLESEQNAVSISNSLQHVSHLDALKARIDETLQQHLPISDSKRLHDAMSYSTLNGGKRLRALLVYSAGQTFDVPLDTLDIPACAVEYVHSYSLIHDDLPAMDDDELRRGKPTCHVKFDEATAILAGDALQAYAFELLTDEKKSALDAQQRLAITHQLAKAGGSLGMAGGQMLDISATQKTLSLSELELMHSLKTGALIEASVLMGALCAKNISPKQLETLSKYAKNIGLAFQIVDDILDETSDTATLGKQSGADKALGKATYPSLMGLDNSKYAAQALIDDALNCLNEIGDNTKLLKALANKVINRIN